MFFFSFELHSFFQRMLAPHVRALLSMMLASGVISPLDILYILGIYPYININNNSVACFPMELHGELQNFINFVSERERANSQEAIAVPPSPPTVSVIPAVSAAPVVRELSLSPVAVEPSQGPSLAPLSSGFNSAAESYITIDQVGPSSPENLGGSLSSYNWHAPSERSNSYCSSRRNSINTASTRLLSSSPSRRFASDEPGSPSSPRSFSEMTTMILDYSREESDYSSGPRRKRRKTSYF